MAKSIIKRTQITELSTAKSGNARKIISEVDIRRRAFEICKENGVNSQNELDNWFRAERELRGSDQ
jgi:Protein of unknown function (DUF2934)